MKLEISNDKYCCVHFLRKGKNVKILTSIFRGTIIDGYRCRHHNSLTRFAFFFASAMLKIAGAQIQTSIC